jgi:hypothetical protein
MKRGRRKENKQLIRTVQFFIIIGVITGLLGVTYAAYSNILATDFNLDTSSLSFVFDCDNKAVVHMENYSEGIVQELKGEVDYQDKKLIITGIGPIDMQEFATGDINITIDYAIKAEDIENSLKRPAEVDKKSEVGYDLGTVDFELLSHTPVWNLENGSKIWGTESAGIEKTPDIIYQYLPDDLGTFHVYNTLIPGDEDGVMTGTLLLKQESVPALPSLDEIGLSSLSLPEGVCNEIKSGSPVSSLEIKGSYGFVIPLNLEQFNMKQ